MAHEQFGSPAEFALLMANNPAKAAEIMAAHGIRIGESSVGAGVLGEVQGAAGLTDGQAGATDVKGGLNDITKALAAVQALTPQVAPKAQAIPTAPLPKQGSPQVNPQLAQIMQLLMGGQGAAGGQLPTLAQLISGR